MSEASMKIGCAGATELDRIDLAVEMTAAPVGYLGMDCLAERTLAMAQLRRLEDPDGGYNPLLAERMRGMLPNLAANGIRLASNMGAANPAGAAEAIAAVAAEEGIENVALGVIEGDDLFGQADELELEFDETGGGVESLPGPLVSLNAYLGAEPVAEALHGGADLVVGGRIGDLSLYLGCMMHHHGWEPDDWERLGAGSVVAHLLECGRYVTGGAFSEPGWGKAVPGQEDLGFPIAEIEADATARLSRPDSKGGMVSVDTVKEQLAYETHDPARYITPDVVVDLTEVRVEADPDGRVRVSGGRGTPRTDTLKVLAGVSEGFIAEGEISFGGRGAVAKAEEGERIVAARLRRRAGLRFEESRTDLIGVRSILSGGPEAAAPAEHDDVRLRFAVRTPDREAAEAAAFEFQDLWFGPAGGAGARSSVRPIVSLYSCLVPRERIPVSVEVRQL